MKKLILHPILFSIAPVLYFLSANKGELSVLDSRFLLTVLAAILLALTLWVFFKFVLKSWPKGAVLTTISLIFFFNYGYVRDLIPTFKISLGVTSIGPDKTLLITGGLLLLGVLTVLWRTKRSIGVLTKFLNVASVFLLVLLLVDIVPQEIQSRMGATVEEDFEVQSEDVELTLKEADNSPDIYYFILDRYARGDVLKEEYDYDNSEFINYLKDKGFYVASDSFANYPRTWYSSASSLNMKHLTYLEGELGENFQSRLPVYEMLQDYEVWRFLKARGYKFIHFGDWVSFTAKNRFADENINYFGLIGNEFFGNFLKNTMAYPVYKKLFPASEIARKRHLYKFDRLTEMPEVKGPKFVFVHMLIPHEPFVFDRDGSPVTVEQAAQRSLEENYLNQLVFLNQKMAEVIDNILENSPKPPVVIIQSDEGPFPSGWGEESNSEDGVSDEFLKIKSAILNAYYFPGLEQQELLYPHITPVNSFRLLFNSYFGSDYKLLEDDIFIPEKGYLYRFVDVNGRLR